MFNEVIKKAIKPTRDHSGECLSKSGYSAKEITYDCRSVRYEGGQKENQFSSGDGQQLLFNNISVDTYVTNVQKGGRSPSCVFCSGWPL